MCMIYCIKSVLQKTEASNLQFSVDKTFNRCDGILSSNELPSYNDFKKEIDHTLESLSIEKIIAND